MINFNEIDIREPACAYPPDGSDINTIDLLIEASKKLEIISDSQKKYEEEKKPYNNCLIILRYFCCRGIFTPNSSKIHINFD